MVFRILQFIRDAFNFRRLELKETIQAHREMLKKLDKTK